MAVTRETDMLTIRVDYKSIEKFKTALPVKSIERAVRRATDETAQWLSTRIMRFVSANMGIKQKLLKTRVLRSTSARDPKQGRNAAYVWLGGNRIQPRRVGKLENFASGAFGGEYFFEGGFVATMPTGHTGIFKRRGSKRLKIDEQYIEIDQVVNEAINRLLPRAENELERKLEQKIQLELERMVA